MSRRYEYNFVRLESDQSWWTGATVPSAVAREFYQDAVHEHARDGWRLVQIFAPGLGVHGAAIYFELIFEREIVPSDE